MGSNPTSVTNFSTTKNIDRVKMIVYLFVVAVYKVGSQIETREKVMITLT